MERRRVCDNCLQARSTMLCSRCKSTAYCSEECRKTHWTTHHHAQCLETSPIGVDIIERQPESPRKSSTAFRPRVIEESDDSSGRESIAEIASVAIQEIPVGVSALKFCRGTEDACSRAINQTKDVILKGDGTPGMTIDEFIDRLLDADQEMLRRFKEALRYVYGETWKLYRRLLTFLEREIEKIKTRFFNARGKKWDDPDLKGEHGLADEEMEGFSRAETRVVDLLLNIREARSYFDEYGDNVKLPDVTAVLEDSDDAIESRVAVTAVTPTLPDTEEYVPGTPNKIFVSLLEESDSDATLSRSSAFENDDFSDLESSIGAKTRSSGGGGGSLPNTTMPDLTVRRRQPRRRGSQRAKETTEFNVRSKGLITDLSWVSAKQNVQWTFLTDFTAALDTERTSLEDQSDFISTWVSRKKNSAEWGFNKLTFTKRDLQQFIGTLFEEGFKVKSLKRTEDNILPGAAFEDEEDADDDDATSVTTVRSLAEKKKLLEKQLRKKSAVDQQEELSTRVFNIVDTLEAINNMIGLENIKQRIVKLVVRFITRPRRIFGDVDAGISPQHLGVMYLGPPGTGKTTLARKVANVFRALGMVPTKYSNTEDIRVFNSGDFIAAFEGQTPLKTRNVFLSVLGDSFLLDEIYELGRSVPLGAGSETGGSGTGIEALNTLVQLLDQFKGLIAPQGAGYKNLIEQQIYKANRGFKRRFPNQWAIFTYQVEELIAYFRLLIKKKRFAITFRNTQDNKADSDPVGELEADRSRVQQFAEGFIMQARQRGFFVDSNSAGVEVFVTEIADAVDVRNIRNPNPITAEGRHTVILEDILTGIEEFVVSSGKPRTAKEVIEFDQRDASLVFFYRKPIVDDNSKFFAE